MKKIVFVILVNIILVFTAGCFGIFDLPRPTYTPKPVYDFEETEEDGMTVSIAGVVYKELPKTKWEMHPDGKVYIGYGGSKDVTILAVKGDVIRNFIYVYTDRFDGGTILYRTDIKVPEPSGDSVDKIIFSERDFSIREGDDCINAKFAYDRLIIKEFFDELQDNSDTVFSPEEVNDFGDIYFEIICKSKKVLGASYSLELKYLNGNLVCGNNIDGFVKVSLEVIEKLVGQPIDLEQLIRES